MPSLGDLLGLNAGKKIKQASKDAEARLAAGKSEAQGYLGQGRDDILSGFSGAQAAYDAAAPGMRSDLLTGFGGADAALRSGYGSAVDAVTAGRDDANARLDPFVQSGAGAQGLYDNALGVNGREAATSFYDDYGSNDPFRTFRDEQAQREIERRYNASGGFQGGGAGGGGSGRFATAVARSSLERGTQDMQAYLDRLERAGARGAQYAGQQGANSMTAGSQLGTLYAGQGTALAGNAANQGSALAQLGLGMADRTAGLQTGRGTALSGNSSALADLAYGHAGQLAANRINTANGVNQANAVPMQNLIGVAGVAAKAFNPVPKFG